MSRKMKGSSINIHHGKVPRVTIVVLNLNGWKDTIECLESLRQIDYPNYDITIVDNGSQDGSVEKIREYVRGEIRVESRYLKSRYESRPWKLLEFARAEIEGKAAGSYSSTSHESIIVIRNEKNFGFAEGNNIAMRFALRSLKPEYILLLNNDVAVDKSFLTRLVRVAESRSEIGIVGPKVYYYDFSGRSDVINFAGEDIVLWQGKGTRYGFNEVDSGQYDRLRKVDKIEGVCILMKTALLEKVGLLDTAFHPIYWEETDLCIRSKKEGYKIFYVPESRIWHKVSTSFGGSSSPNKEYLMTRNRFIFVKKNANAKEKLGFMFYFSLFDVWIHAFFLVKLNGARLFPPFIRGARDGLKKLVTRHNSERNIQS